MASLNTGDFSSTPSPRILQLARHRESKAVWFTTPRKLTWGNQEPIWPLSWAALKAVPTQRIQVLSRPKRDFSALHQDLLRNARTGEEMTKSARLVSSAAQYEHMNRLATPRSRPWSSREVRPPHTEFCEYNCPVWHITPAVRSAVASPRLLQLAQPKLPHPDYTSSRQTAEIFVPCRAKSAQLSARLEQLCAPRIRENELVYPYGSPESSIRPVSKGARKAVASARLRELSIPRPLARGYTPPRELS